MNTFTKTVLIGAALVATAGTAMAFGPHGEMMPGMGYGMGPGMGHGMGSGMGPGMRHGMGPGMMGRGMGPGMMGHGMGLQGGMFNHASMLDRIPNLTDDQRKQLTQLQTDQVKTMEGFRKQMLVQRDSVKARLGEILTEDQQAALPVFQH